MRRQVDFHNVVGLHPCAEVDRLAAHQFHQFRPGDGAMRILFGVAVGDHPAAEGVLQTGEPIIEGEVTAETPAHPGAPRHFMHNYYPDRSKDGTVVGVSCVVYDITERI